MGQATGFLEYGRENPGERPAGERVQDWGEFQRPFPEEAARRQGARCMDCGIPFCHTGLVFSGAVSGCPLHNLIPEWNDLVYRGLWREALHRLLKTNNFPEFTGRVCPAPCEGSCALGLHDPAVTIKAIENQIIEQAFERGWMQPEPPPERTGWRVAVVGSGPAGLSCADTLSRAGHQVAVYERADRIGGLLMYGIPNMKLDKREVLQRRLDLMASAGVNFITGTEVGRDVEARKLRDEYDALVLCCGATVPRDLSVPGRTLAGIHPAVDFLTSSTRALLEPGVSGPSISARDKDVIIIGGGDTGTDCVATALRQGANSVVQFEILPEPPSQREADNPWPEWPRTVRHDYGHREAIAVSGRDPRRYQVQTRRFAGVGGDLQAVHTVAVRWERDAEGRMNPQEIPGTDKVWPTQLVLLAMGFLGPESTLVEELDLSQDERSNVQAVEGRHRTSAEGVFVAGDMRRGQSLVVWAIAEGRRAAREVESYLREENPLPVASGGS